MEVKEKLQQFLRIHSKELSADVQRFISKQDNSGTSAHEKISSLGLMTFESVVCGKVLKVAEGVPGGARTGETAEQDEGQGNS